MIGNKTLGFLCSFLLYVQCTVGFSNISPLYGRSKNVALTSSFSGQASTRVSTFPGSRFMSTRQKHFDLMATNEEEMSEGATGDATAGDQTAEEEALEKKLAGRKKRLKLGYQVASLSYVATSLFGLFSWGSFSASAFYYAVGGGPLNMAVILYILKGAAVHDRLGSDTYKRLNLAIMSYAFIQLLIPAGSTSLKLPGLLAFVNGLKGYGYGVLGWDKAKETSTIVTDMKDGVVSTVKGLVTIKAKSLGYMLGTLMLGSMSLLKFKELCSSAMILPPLTTAETVTRLSKLARFGLMTTIMYTLKDASDRDRLSGTTFVQLNFVAAAAFLSISLYLLPTFGTAFANAQILVACGLCAMTLWKGLTSKKA